MAKQLLDDLMERSCELSREEKQHLAGFLSEQVKNSNGDEDVAFPQEQSTRRAHRFLSAPDVDAARDHAAAIKAGQFLLENPRLQHPAKRFQVALVRRGLGRGGFAGPFRSLKHALI